MLIPKTAPYGSWKSPLTSDLIAAQSISLSEPRLDGEQVYWLEGRPQELGRYVVVRASSPGGHGADMTPKPYNARTRVHEYGGASWTVADGDVYFSNFADGRLYCQRNGTSHPAPLTPEPAVRERQWRFADGVIDGLRQLWIGVREDHTAGGEPINTIVAVDLQQPAREPGRVLVRGHDFFASPRLSPDGRSLIWLGSTGFGRAFRAGVSSTLMTVLMALNSSLQRGWSMTNGWSSGAAVLAATPRWRHWCFGISFTAVRATMG